MPRARRARRAAERLGEEHKSRFRQILGRFEGRSIDPYGMEAIKKSFDESNMHPEVAEDIMDNLEKIADHLENEEHIKDAIKAKFDGLAGNVTGNERDRLEEKKTQIINETDNIFRGQFGIDLITNHVAPGIMGDPERLAEVLNNVAENFDLSTLAHLTPDPLHQAIENLGLSPELKAFLAFLGEHTLDPRRGGTVNLIFNPRDEHDNLREQVREAVRGIREGRYTEEDIQKMFENRDYYLNYLLREYSDLKSFKDEILEQQDEQKKAYNEAQFEKEYTDALLTAGKEYFYFKERGRLGSLFGWLGHYLGFLNPLSWFRGKEREAPKSHIDVLNDLKTKFPGRAGSLTPETFEKKLEELARARMAEAEA